MRYWIGALFLGLALAQSTLGVEPPVLLKEAAPGQVLTTTLTVHNVGDKPVRVRVSAGDWTYDPLGQLQYLPPGTLKESASPWLSFSPSELLLGPKQSGKLTYTLAVPKDAKPGSHWGVLFLEGEDPDPPPGLPLATFRVRLGHVYYVNLPPVERGGRVSGILPTPPKAPDDPYRFAVKYQNTGNVAQKVSGRFEVRDQAGKVVASLPVEEVVVLPKSERILPISLVGPLPAGAYTAFVLLNYGDPTKDVAADYPFQLKAPLAAPKTAPTQEGQK
ncbi:hypothetical protein [Thermus filiformis]|uniref:Pili assembly chaperone N-terminal domain-containing protein n=1 Tax=Thermus filiformis TaxID=276 RepID=A0A0A2WUB5_THEFI|nr:hypothetical protein [Thermus filiformis]KGQ21910.1 hypothetical protein THFILI_00500 [Thermus filiformis]